jgi:hypothetical protein
MQLRVALSGPMRLASLAQELDGLLDANTVSVDARRGELCVEAEDDVDRTIIKVVAAVQAWLEGAGGGPARIFLDRRSYTFAGRLLPPRWD